MTEVLPYDVGSGRVLVEMDDSNGPNIAGGNAEGHSILCMSRPAAAFSPVEEE